MVLGLHGTSWVTRRHLRVFMDCLGSLCNGCFCGTIQGVMKQFKGSMDNPRAKSHDM